MVVKRRTISDVTLTGVGNSRRLLGAVVAFAVLAATSCSSGSSAVDTLAKHLIAVSALEQPAWGLRLQKAKSTGRDFGVPTRADLGAQPSGSPPTTLPLAKAKAVVTRQWIRGSGQVAGRLPEGVLTVSDLGAQFPSVADADAFVVELSAGAAGGRPTPVEGVSGATYFGAPLPSSVTGGEPLGRQDVVILRRGSYVFTVAITGGGSRPSAADAKTLAMLQSSAMATI
jgi:hypothetical protein